MADETPTPAPDPVIRVNEPGKQAEVPVAPNPLPHYGDSGLGTSEVHLDAHGQWAPGPAPAAPVAEPAAETVVEEKAPEEHKAE